MPPGGAARAIDPGVGEGTGESARSARRVYGRGRRRG